MGSNPTPSSIYELLTIDCFKLTIVTNLVVNCYQSKGEMLPMPIYEYQCSVASCGYQKTEILPLQMCEAEMKCPKCDAPMLKLMTIPGMVKVK